MTLTLTAIPDRLIKPMYSFAEADHLAGATAGTTRRWIKGYGYVRNGKRIEQPPVTPRTADVVAASFFDLLEVVVISRLKKYGLSLGAVRRMVKNCVDLFEYERPLVQARFKTDGREVFVDQGDRLVEVGRRKREAAWNLVLEPFLAELHYTDEWADQWRPLGPEQPILVDPEYGFGQPVIEGSGVRTEIIIERIRAGDLPDEIAKDFNVTSLQVYRAIQYEASRLAA